MSNLLRTAYPNLLITRAENGYILTAYPAQFSRDDVPQIAAAIKQAASLPGDLASKLIDLFAGYTKDRMPVVEVYNDFGDFASAIADHLALPAEMAAALEDRNVSDVANICGKCSYYSDEDRVALPTCPECGGEMISFVIHACRRCGGRLHLERLGDREPGHPHEQFRVYCEDCDYTEIIMPFKTDFADMIEEEGLRRAVQNAPLCPACGDKMVLKPDTTGYERPIYVCNRCKSEYMPEATGANGLHKCPECQGPMHSLGYNERGYTYKCSTCSVVGRWEDVGNDDMRMRLAFVPLKDQHCEACGGDRVYKDEPTTCFDCGGKMIDLAELIEEGKQIPEMYEPAARTGDHALDYPPPDVTAQQRHTYYLPSTEDDWQVFQGDRLVASFDEEQEAQNYVARFPAAVSILEIKQRESDTESGDSQPEEG